jgi:hypothetical protein
MVRGFFCGFLGVVTSLLRGAYGTESPTQEAERIRVAHADAVRRNDTWVLFEDQKARDGSNARAHESNL